MIHAVQLLPGLPFTAKTCIWDLELTLESESFLVIKKGLIWLFRNKLLSSILFYL